MRRKLAALVLAATSIGAVAAVSPVSQAANAETEPLRYVALGDSYSAASGVLPVDPSSPFCLRSTRNYPHVIAQKAGAALTDVTCGAAETKDFFTAQNPGVRPQLDALKPDTQLVTMTIGGNDSGVFINTIVDCGAAGILSGGQGNPCQKKYGDSFENTIRNKTYPDLVKALAAVHQRSPDAEVAILGYPWITPPTKGCFDKMPIATGDVPYVHHIQWTLNDAIRRAASVTGTTFVDMDKVSTGHDACKPIGVRWIEPVTQGTNPVVVHPNALGEARMADQSMRVLGLS
jgi:lysophospholipase L1-like esterase